MFLTEVLLLLFRWFVKPFLHPSLWLHHYSISFLLQSLVLCFIYILDQSMEEHHKVCCFSVLLNIKIVLILYFPVIFPPHNGRHIPADKCLMKWLGQMRMNMCLFEYHIVTLEKWLCSSYWYIPTGYFGICLPLSPTNLTHIACHRYSALSLFRDSRGHSYLRYFLLPLPGTFFLQIIT